MRSSWYDWARRRNSCRQLQMGPAWRAAASPTSISVCVYVCVCVTPRAVLQLCGGSVWLWDPQVMAGLLRSLVWVLPALQTCLCLGVGLSLACLPHLGMGGWLGSNVWLMLAHTHQLSPQPTLLDALGSVRWQ